MTFLAPAFLLGALAIALPIALHLLRRDVAPDLPFTAVRLLKRSPIERARRRRLRDVLLLAARVTALLLLAAAFARPFVPGNGSAMVPLTIVAIDRSFSMGAPGRFDRARELARAAIDEVGARGRVAVIAFDERADVAAPPGSRGDALLALGSVQPGTAGTRYGPLLGKAADLASGGPARLVLVTDLQRAGWEGESRIRTPASLQVEIRDAGAPAANLAIADATVGEEEVRVSIRNASGVARQGTLTMQHEGREVSRAAYSIGPHAGDDVALRWKRQPGGLVLALSDPEGFPADDTRHLVVGHGSGPGILVVTSPDAPGFYVGRALDAAHAGGVASFGARLVTPAEITGGRAQTIAAHRAIVLLSTRNLDRAAREAIAAFVTNGGGLLVAAAPDVEPVVVGSMFGWGAGGFVPRTDSVTATLAATDLRHPILRPFGGFAANLGQVRFARSWRVAGEGWQVPARFDDGTPALLERTHGRGRVVLFASDLDRRWNDFPLHPSFVPFVVEAVRHVASRPAEPDTFLVGRVPPGIQGEPGVHRLESGRLVAVNVDARESGIGVMTPAEFTSMIETVPQAEVDSTVRAEQVESRQSLWQYGLILMLLVLVAESFAGRA